MGSWKSVRVLAWFVTLTIMTFVVTFNWAGYTATGKMPSWFYFVFAGIFSLVGLFFGYARYSFSYNLIALGNGKDFLWIRPSKEKDEALIEEGQRQVASSALISFIFLLALAATILGPVARMIIRAFRA